MIHTERLRAMESNDSLVCEITDDFLARLERGENPQVSEYITRHPRQADLLQKILPALQVMKQSGFDQTSQPVVRESAPALSGTLGDYRLIREIGRGGMGVVYEAEQISLQRRVALKTLSFAAALNSSRLERFKYEAQAAARLHHSNIVPVYSVGCERGVWYYAMQIIEGETLADAIAELRQVHRLVDRRHAQALTAHLDHVTRDAAPKDEPRYSPEPEFLPIADALPSADAESRTAPSAIEQRGSRDGKLFADVSPSSAPARPADQWPTASPDEASEVQTKNAAGTGSRPLAARTTAQLLSTTSSHKDRGYVRLAVDIAIQAAEALQHAHDLDIVHRDIKPANLMIDGRGHVWVADFGLARCRDDARLTATGDMIGTLAYMSPEQVSGHRGTIDHRTDIYSLGATLYELLTLHSAFEDTSRAALIYRISTEDPTPIRRLNSAVPADLETIIQKAMAREPESRYASASEMAEDLRRFRDSRPILARRPSILERLFKWSRRHRSAVTVAVAGSLLLTVGMVVSTILIARAHALTTFALSETRQALVSEARQLQQAEQNLQLAQRNFDKARDVLGSFMTIAEVEMSGQEELQETRSQMLQICLNYYQDFIDTARDNKPLQAKLVLSHQRVARILHTIGSTSASREALEQALQTQERLVSESPDDETLRRSLFHMYLELGAFDGAGPIYLLKHESVQQDLMLTTEQVATAEKISSHFRETFHVSCDPDRSDDLTSARQQFRSGTVQALNQLAGLLSAEQIDRLRQIDLQRRGCNAWNSPDVADELCLTALQRVRIRDIGDELHALFRSKDGKDVCQKVKQLHADLDAVLTDEQSLIWQEMTGVPFKGQTPFWHGKSHDERTKSTLSPKPAPESQAIPVQANSQ